MIEPVTLAQAKARLRIVANDRDDEIKGLIAGARAHLEQFTGRILTGPREVTEKLTSLGVARLRTTPVIDVVRLEYAAGDGSAAVPITGALVANGYLVPAIGESFPVLAPRAYATAVLNAGNPVTAAGADQVAVIEPDLVVAILMMTRHLFDNPSAVITGTVATELPLGVKALAHPHRIMF